MDRYIGLDVHAASTTIAIVGPSGRAIGSKVVETNGRAIVEALKSVPGQRHVCLEESTQAEWLYEVIKPYADEVVVTQIDNSRGPKSDARDAFALANLLRTRAIKTSVFKDVGPFGVLRELSRVYTMVTGDVVRTKNRIKALFRSRGVLAIDSSVYTASGRRNWLKRLPKCKHAAAEMLYAELDAQAMLKDRAERELLDEARKHRAVTFLKSCPGLGPIRAALLAAIVITPHRFRTKRQFWAYCGLAIVMRSSSDWVQTKDRQWTRATVVSTRGLNFNHNHLAKSIFKGAATTAIAQPASPLRAAYEKSTAAGTKPNLAKLTIARRIAALALAVWKHEEEYDPKRDSKPKIRLAS